MRRIDSAVSEGGFGIQMMVAQAFQLEPEHFMLIFIRIFFDGHIQYLK